VNRKKCVNGLSLFILSYLITLMAYLCSQWTRNAQMKYFLFDWSICRPFSPNNDIRICLLDIRHSWTKTRLETWIKRNDVNGVCLSHLSYLITLMACLCSQSTPNIQNKYITFNWSIYRLFVLNRAWKRDSPNNDILICVLHMKFSLIKRRFVTWISKNDWNGLSLFNLTYVKTLMAYVCSQRTPNVQNMYFKFDCSKYILFVLNTA
jgi:hypothetical protein